MSRSLAIIRAEIRQQERLLQEKQQSLDTMGPQSTMFMPAIRVITGLQKTIADLQKEAATLANDSVAPAPSIATDSFSLTASSHTTPVKPNVIDNTASSSSSYQTRPYSASVKSSVVSESLTALDVASALNTSLIEGLPRPWYLKKDVQRLRSSLDQWQAQFESNLPSPPPLTPPQSSSSSTMQIDQTATAGGHKHSESPPDPVEEITQRLRQHRVSQPDPAPTAMPIQLSDKTKRMFGQIDDMMYMMCKEFRCIALFQKRRLSDSMPPQLSASALAEIITEAEQCLALWDQARQGQASTKSMKSDGMDFAEFLLQWHKFLVRVNSLFLLSPTTEVEVLQLVALVMAGYGPFHGFLERDEGLKSAVERLLSHLVDRSASQSLRFMPRINSHDPGISCSDVILKFIRRIRSSPSA